MTSHLLLAFAFNAVLGTVCVYALLRGGTPERLGALINFTACGISTLLRLCSLAYYAPSSLTMLAIDLTVTGGFFFLATRTTRFWPIWACGFALADVLMSVAGVLMPLTPLFAFHTGLGIYAYLALAALAIGTFCLPRNAPADLRHGFRPWTTMKS